MNPWRVSLIVMSPRRRSTRTDSDSMIFDLLSGSLGSRGTSWASAFDTTFCVTTTTSPSCIAGVAFISRSARSSPGRTSPMPRTGITRSPSSEGVPLLCPVRPFAGVRGIVAVTW
jgi:hypothetical protein